MKAAFGLDGPQQLEDLEILNNKLKKVCPFDKLGILDIRARRGGRTNQHRSPVG